MCLDYGVDEFLIHLEPHDGFDNFDVDTETLSEFFTVESFNETAILVSTVLVPNRDGVK